MISRLSAGTPADVPADRVGDAQLAHHLELQDRRGGELLGHRHDVVDGVAASAHAVFAVREAEARAVHELAVTRGDQRPARARRGYPIDEPTDL